VAGALALADRDLALDLAMVAAAGVLLYLGARQLLLGRARTAFAGAALLVLAAGVAVALDGPAPAPRAAAASVKAGATAQPSTARDRPAPSTAAPAGGPRICFASMRDAHAAEEGAAIPAGAGVKVLSDGRVCVREG
jgi:hypothetical protein